MALEGVQESPLIVLLGLQGVISGLRGSTPSDVVGEEIEGWGPWARRPIDSVLSCQNDRSILENTPLSSSLQKSVDRMKVQLEGGLF